MLSWKMLILAMAHNTLHTRADLFRLAGQGVAAVSDFERHNIDFSDFNFPEIAK